ncbi:hypothetical protein SGL43_03196 [Streptomyces globisporus]|uniref:Uncharacterized protein n=1 Tax=Streptomyces globisporus TaxID=1908 RepID=A0ABN8V167_STRGL|nr:hypothetical protein SGL43_03196 [Streptomyces globisporus]
MARFRAGDGSTTRFTTTTRPPGRPLESGRACAPRRRGGGL